VSSELLDAGSQVRVGALQVDFRIPGSQSLKAKRKVVSSLKDRIRSRFPVAVAEVGHQELWGRGMIGVAAVGEEGGLVERALDETVRLIESDVRVMIVDVVRDSY
jgi:uncharacterized protein YlxP (DUF503 family)